MTNIKPASADSVSQKDLVLAAALEVFSKQGFRGANVRDIADRAGCNHAVIRYHFSTKDNLWREAVAYLFQRMQRIMAISESDHQKLLVGDRDACKRWLKRYLEYCAHYPDHARIMVQASIHDGDKLSWAAEHFIRQRHILFDPIIRALSKNGVLPDHEPVYLLYIISAACQALFTLAPEAEVLHGIVIDDATVEAYSEAVLDVLLR